MAQQRISVTANFKRYPTLLYRKPAFMSTYFVDFPQQSAFQIRAKGHVLGVQRMPQLGRLPRSCPGEGTVHI